MNGSQWGETIIFKPHWLDSWITHMMVGSLKDNFSCKENWILWSNSKVERFLWDHSVNYMSRLRWYASSTQTWPSARQISQRFSRTRGKILKEAHAELQLLKGQASWFCESEKGKCLGVGYSTGVVVFIIMDFHKLIHRLFDDKHGLLLHEKSSFKLI